MTINDTYNGWTNYETWNIALWIENTEKVYRNACWFMKHNTDKKNPYIAFIMNQNMAYGTTGDNVEYMSDELDFDALNNMMKELVA